MKKSSDEKLTKQEISAREVRVLDHFLRTKPESHKPLGKNSQAKRRRKERRAQCAT
jgi:hypothetical protein